MPERNLTNDDIEALAEAIFRKQSHVCQFAGIDRDRLVKSVETTEHINAVTSEAGSAIRVTVIKGGLSALAILLLLGLIVKLREWLGIPLP